MELDLEALNFAVCHSSTPGSPLVLVWFGDGILLSSAILLQASLKTQVIHHPGLQQLWSLLFYFLFFLEYSQKMNSPHLPWKPGLYHICPCWSPFLHRDSWCVFLDLALIVKILTVSCFGLELRWFCPLCCFGLAFFSKTLLEFNPPLIPQQAWPYLSSSGCWHLHVTRTLTQSCTGFCMEMGIQSSPRILWR